MRLTLDMSQSHVLFVHLKMLQGSRKSHPEELTLRWGVVVRVRVALTAVLHQETGIVPGHADDAIRLMQQNVGQHAPVAVHHYHLSICSTEQHLERNRTGLLGRFNTKTKR